MDKKSPFIIFAMIPSFMVITSQPVHGFQLVDRFNNAAPSGGALLPPSTCFIASYCSSFELNQPDFKVSIQLDPISILPLGGTQGMLNLLESSIWASNGFLFQKSTQSLEGKFEVFGYFATDGISNSIPLTNRPGVGGALNLYYLPSGDDPRFNPDLQSNKLHWIQRVRSNHGGVSNLFLPQDLGHGTQQDKIDVFQEQLRPSNPDSFKPFYETFSQDIYRTSSASSFTFLDVPMRTTDIDKPKVWQAELYLVEEVEDKTVKIYDGISWGWSTTVCREVTEIIGGGGSGGSGGFGGSGGSGGSANIVRPVTVTRTREVCEEPPRGLFQDDPILPNTLQGNKQTFKEVPRRRWYDPVTSYGFEFETLGDDLFTGILDFPVGLDSDNLFTVAANNLILGEFGPGDSLDFTDLFGDGISKFTITDISGLGPTPETAFPILLDFNNETVDFTMTRLDSPDTTPVPESKSIYTWLALGVFIPGLFWIHR
jgi:hypothetical protein